MDRIHDIGELVADYSDVEKVDVNAIIDVPILVHDVTVTQSRYHEKGSQRCAVVIFSHADNPGVLRKLMIWRAYMIYTIDKAVAMLNGDKAIGGYYHSAIPFYCKITLVGKFYRIVSANRKAEESDDRPES